MTSRGPLSHLQDVLARGHRDIHQDPLQCASSHTSLHRELEAPTTEASESVCSKPSLFPVDVTEQEPRFRSDGGIVALSDDGCFVAVGNSDRKRIWISDATSLMAVAMISWHWGFKDSETPHASAIIMSKLFWVGKSILVVGGSNGRCVAIRSGLLEGDDDCDDEDSDVEDNVVTMSSSRRQQDAVMVIAEHALDVHGVVLPPHFNFSEQQEIAITHAMVVVHHKKVVLVLMQELSVIKEVLITSVSAFTAGCALLPSPSDLSRSSSSLTVVTASCTSVGVYSVDLQNGIVIASQGQTCLLGSGLRLIGLVASTGSSCHAVFLDSVGGACAEARKISVINRTDSGDESCSTSSEPGSDDGCDGRLMLHTCSPINAVAGGPGASVPISSFFVTAPKIVTSQTRASLVTATVDPESSSTALLTVVTVSDPVPLDKTTTSPRKCFRIDQVRWHNDTAAHPNGLESSESLTLRRCCCGSGRDKPATRNFGILVFSSQFVRLMLFGNSGNGDGTDLSVSLRTVSLALNTRPSPFTIAGVAGTLKETNVSATTTKLGDTAESGPCLGLEYIVLVGRQFDPDSDPQTRKKDADAVTPASPSHFLEDLSVHVQHCTFSLQTSQVPPSSSSRLPHLAAHSGSPAACDESVIRRIVREENDRLLTIIQSRMDSMESRIVAMLNSTLSRNVIVDDNRTAVEPDRSPRLQDVRARAEKRLQELLEGEKKQYLATGRSKLYS